MTTIREAMLPYLELVADKMRHRPKLVKMFEQCFMNTLDTTIFPMQDQSTFVITGDIPAMWLRDSAAQVRTYLTVAEHNEEMADLIAGVVRRQVQYILHDPYANAFNQEANGKRWDDDLTEMTDWIWERKYEVDSLCYPIQLAYLLWKQTGRAHHLDESFHRAIWLIVHTWKKEQHHELYSDYRFMRPNAGEKETLPREGLGSPVGYTGMTWSGYRPSDDACKYGYLIPANMFAVVVLKYAAEIALELWNDPRLAKDCLLLAEQIQSGIERYGIYRHPKYGTIYAYETDGYGSFNLMDDANVPSLLSLPYLGYCEPTDPIYQNTRKFLLGKDNPYYFEGKAASGIGSAHTSPNYIWHIALIMQSLTSTSAEEKERILEILEATDADTGFMHEGFNADNPHEYTRPWFSWANSLFCELVLKHCGAL